MIDDRSDDRNGDEPLILTEPTGRAYAVTYDEDMDEVVEILERKQKILAKIICVPGTKTYVAEWMRKTYEIILEADNKATIETKSGLKITSYKSFPTGKQFTEAFKPLQSEDTTQYMPLKPANCQLPPSSTVLLCPI